MANIFSRNRKNLNPMLILLSLTVATAMLFFTVPVFADTGDEGEHGKSLELVLQEVRARLGVETDAEIDPRNVSDEELEELGEAVMSIMHPGTRQHELMDRMMGGEGSERLERAHRRMGYNYLSNDGDEVCFMSGRRGGRGRMGLGMM